MAQMPDGELAPLSGLLPALAAEGLSQRTLHAYLHIPFCRVRCGYCDYNTYTSTELRGVTQNSFLDNLLGEIRFSKDVLNNSGLEPRKFSTVFFGGGTPTQLAAEQLALVLETLRTEFGIEKNAEVTTEANPDTVDERYLNTLSEAGFTRVSIGMQSSVASVLKTLDRTHNPENVAKAVAAAKAAGLQVSVDLIYGTPGESLDDWRASLSTAIALEPNHISAYSLIVEPGTKLARQVRNGELNQPSDDDHADKYEIAEEMISAAGFDWYEVCNWRRGEASMSQHNLAYWRSNDWWGYGPGAHSHIGGTRWWNVKHPSAYAERLAASQSPALARENLNEIERATERVLLELRLREGIPIDYLKSINPGVAKPISQFIADGMVNAEDAIRGQVTLTLKGRLITDAIVRDLLA
jgi:putative oxygen-independent coproporphyrinogen III oxidase